MISDDFMHGRYVPQQIDSLFTRRGHKIQNWANKCLWNMCGILSYLGVFAEIYWNLHRTNLNPVRPFAFGSFYSMSLALAYVAAWTFAMEEHAKYGNVTQSDTVLLFWVWRQKVVLSDWFKERTILYTAEISCLCHGPLSVMSLVICFYFLKLWTICRGP